MQARRPALGYLLAAVSGGLQILIFPVFSLTLLAPIAVAPLLVAIAWEPRRLAQFRLGWLAGSIYWAGTCYWVYGVMHHYGHLAAPAAAAIFVGFFVVKGLHLGVFSLLAAPLLRRAWALPAVAAAWVAIEGSHQYLAFTWLLLGNAGVNMSVLGRLAPYTGVYGLSFAFAMMNAAVALLVLRRPRRELAWLAVLPLLFLLPPLPQGDAGRQAVRLVQPNVHPDELIEEPWTAVRARRHLERMEKLSTEIADAIDPSPPALVIWPEYPVPAYYFDSPGWRSFMEALARKTGAYLIFNTIAFRASEPRRPLNAAVVLDPGGTLISRYAKIFLVPFGEFVPWPFSLFIDKITLEAGDFVPGDAVSVAPVGAHGVGTFICYEAVFARGVRRFVANGAEVLVNISNDSWYGRSAARYQHLWIVRMRAIENARWILRATNDGITSIVDAAGQVVSALPSYEQGVLCGRFSYRSERTWYSRYGEWFWWSTVLATGVLLPLAAWRQRRPSEDGQSSP